MSQPTNNEILNLFFCMAPQFKTDDADTLECYNTIIDEIKCQVENGAISCCIKLAYVYLLGHILTIRDNSTSGSVSSISEGDLSISYAISPTSTYLESTSWGKAYKDLIKRTVFSPYVTNVPKNLSARSYYNGQCGC